MRLAWWELCLKGGKQPPELQESFGIGLESNGSPEHHVRSTGEVLSFAFDHDDQFPR